MAQVRPPRSVFVDFPLGHQCGRPGDTRLQMNILKDALDTLVNAAAPGTIVDLSYQWGKTFSWESYQKDVQEMIKEAGDTMQDWLPKKNE